MTTNERPYLRSDVANRDYSGIVDEEPTAADALRGALLAYLEETYELSDETRQDIEAVDLDEVANYVLTEVWQ